MSGPFVPAREDAMRVRSSSHHPHDQLYTGVPAVSYDWHGSSPNKRVRDGSSMKNQ